jgi:DHA2 family multidrug resistance protein
LGPTLGGWLTDNYSWRWAFYINVPVGIVAVLMITSFVEDPPYITSRAKGKIDWFGFLLMAVALGTLQIILDKGQQDDWFAAAWIRWFSFASVTSLIVFILWELKTGEPIVNLKVFRDRNFAVGTLLFALVGLVLYSAITLIPLFLQPLMGYSALQSGIAVSPRGAGALITMPIVGYLTAKVDFRRLIGLGFFLVAVSLWIISNLSLETPIANIAWPSVLTGVGLSMLFVPLTTVSMGTLPQKDIGNASGIFNLMRNVGGSFGVSILTTYLARHSQANQVTLVSNLSSLNMPYQQKLAEIQNFFAGRIPPAGAFDHARGYLYSSLLKQAQLLSFVQGFRMLAILSLVCIGLAFLLKRVRQRKPIAAH